MYYNNYYLCVCVGTKKPAPTALVFNCGFARVSIHEPSSEHPTTCPSEFRNQIGECSQYVLSDEQFNDRGEIQEQAKFEYARQAILKAFTKKWYPQESKEAYATTFSRTNWKHYRRAKSKLKHTLSFCQEYREKHYHLQKMFPCAPLYSFPPTTTTTVTLSSAATIEKELTSAVLRDLNGTYIQQYGHTFVDSLVENCKEVDKKKTKEESAEYTKKCRDKVNEQLAENVALHTLAEDESLARYQRKHLTQSFEKPPAPQKAQISFPFRQ
jgi:predicted HicB family RNase H-like nuclease